MAARKKKKPVKKKSIKKKPAKRPAAKKARSKAKPRARAAGPKLVEGSVVWMGLNTPNQMESARFYRQVLKLSSKMVPGGEKPMMILSSGKTDIAHATEMIEDRGPRWMVFFYAKDVDAAASEAAKAGGKIQIPPMDIPEGRFCVMLDPHGIEFAVFNPN